MNLPDGLSLRDATTDDLPAIARLRDAVGWAVHDWALRAVLGQPHARCVVVEDPRGELVAVGSGIVYGPLGFIGNMVVAASHRRRGLGSAVLRVVCEFLEGAGCRRLELNATSDGRPLYERHGFGSIGTSVTATLGEDQRLRPDPAVVVRDATTADGEGLAGYDAPRFGGDRRPIIELLVTDPGFTTLVAERDGAIVGYAGLRTDPLRIGPMLADDPGVAETLVVEGFARTGAATLRLNLPPGNRLGTAWLERLGAPIEPWDGRMARGEPIPRRDDTIYGMAVGALG